MVVSRVTSGFLAALLCLVAMHGFAQGGKPKPDLPVTSTLNDSGSVTPDPGTNYRLQSDGAGSYHNGVSSVESIIQGIGDWVMDTAASASRSVLVDFRDPVAGSSTFNAPFNWQLVHARLISKCSAVGVNYTTIALNATVNCPLHAVFSFGGASYRLTMNPLNDAASSFVNVTCGSTDASGKCNRWTIAPITQADTSVRSIAVLLRDTTVKRKTTTTNLGYFYMTFQIGVTNP